MGSARRSGGWPNPSCFRSRFLHRLFTFRAGSGFGNVRALPARSKRLDTRPLIRVDGPILIFGGPYSNFTATAAVLADAKRLGIAREQTICTRDLTADYGAPAATLDLIRECGIAVVRGNGDKQLALGADDCGCGFTPGGACQQLSSSWFSYASAQVGADARRWLAQLLRRIDLEFDGCLLTVIHG